MDVHSLLQKLPSVEAVLADQRISPHINAFSRKGVTRLVREVVDRLRQSIIDGKTLEIEKESDLEDAVVRQVRKELEKYAELGYRRVINAGGVVIHTNLGRALLDSEVLAEIEKAGSNYIDLEIDLESLDRTKREARASRLISLLTGSEDAHIVNNNAAAVLLAVETLAGDGSVAVSRGELVEIGGSFRLPEILNKAAGRVIEVGTTNRTHKKDYLHAIEKGADLILKVHRSNFQISGYTNEVPLAELVKLGKEKGVPVIYDQGGGFLFRIGLRERCEEESIDEIVPTGVDIVTFSADKLLGGPQGGIILGSFELIERMRQNHLSRALRVDKLTLAGLLKVLSLYWKGEIEKIRVLTMAGQEFKDILDRSEKFAESLRKNVGRGVEVETEDGESAIGGGTFPNNPLRTKLIKINLPQVSPEKLSRVLRRFDPAVLVRIRGNTVLIDLRTVLSDEEQLLEKAILEGIGNILRGSDNDGR